MFVSCNMALQTMLEKQYLEGKEIFKYLVLKKLKSD